MTGGERGGSQNGTGVGRMGDALTDSALCPRLPDSEGRGGRRPRERISQRYSQHQKN
jgi:hypothetical protein